MLNYYRKLQPIERTAIITGLLGVLIIVALTVYFSLGYNMRFIYQLSIGLVGLLMAFVGPVFLLITKRDEVRTEVDPQVFIKDEQARAAENDNYLTKLTEYFRKPSDEDDDDFASEPVKDFGLGYDEGAIMSADSNMYDENYVPGRYIREAMRQRSGEVEEVEEDGMFGEEYVEVDLNEQDQPVKPRMAKD